MELKYSPTSPYARKALVIAHELGIADRLRLTALNPRAEGAALAAFNPLRKIPVLVTDEGDVIFDSPVICEYLDITFGHGRFVPPPGEHGGEC